MKTNRNMKDTQIQLHKTDVCMYLHAYIMHRELMKNIQIIQIYYYTVFKIWDIIIMRIIFNHFLMLIYNAVGLC